MKKTRPFRSTLRSSDPDRIVSFVNPSDQIPMIRMDGPKISIDAVKDELNRTGENKLINIDVDPKLQPGIREVPIASTIERSSIFAKKSIDVSNVRPDTILVKIDLVETRDLEIVPSPDANLDGPATFEPKTIKIRAPHDALVDADTKTNNKLQAIAQFPTTGDLAKPGPHSDVKLNVDIPILGQNVTTVGPRTVVASYAVKASSIKMDIPSLLIHTEFVGNSSNNLVVDFPTSKVLTNVTIIGPKAKCEKVIQNSESNNPPVPYATVSIEPEDQPQRHSGLQDRDQDVWTTILGTRM